MVDGDAALDRQRAEVPRHDREDRRPRPLPGRRGGGGHGGRQGRRLRAGAARRGDQRGFLPRHPGAGDRQLQPRRGQAAGDRGRSRGRSRERRHAAVRPRRPVIASPSGAELREAAALAAGGSNPFTATSFHDRIARDYRDGAGWLFAADLHTLVRKGQEKDSSESQQMAEKLGILDLDHFIIDRREVDGRAETRAALTFDQARREVALLDRRAGADGELELFLPDANLAAAFVVKSPVTILDELLAVNPEFARELAEAQSKHGFDLRNDLAAPLGGEIALGVDGPVLPTPSWKLVAEVYEPARLQQTFERAVARLNDELRAEGKAGIQLSRRGERRPYVLRRAGQRAQGRAPLRVRGRLPGGRSQPGAARAVAPAAGVAGDAGDDGQVPRPARSGRPGERLGSGLPERGAAGEVGLQDPARRHRQDGARRADRRRSAAGWRRKGRAPLRLRGGGPHRLRRQQPEPPGPQSRDAGRFRRHLRSGGPGHADAGAQ